MIFQIDEKANKVSRENLNTAFFVHSELGPGLLESIYEKCLVIKLEKAGLFVETQKILPFYFEGEKIDGGLRIDILVENCVIVELKACEKILPIHHAQIHTYLKLSKLNLGLILNFNETSLKNGIKRIVTAQNNKENFV